jgi:hypothetical protein
MTTAPSRRTVICVSKAVAEIEVNTTLDQNNTVIVTAICRAVNLPDLETVKSAVSDFYSKQDATTCTITDDTLTVTANFSVYELRKAGEYADGIPYTLARLTTATPLYPNSAKYVILP